MPAGDDCPKQLSEILIEEFEALAPPDKLQAEDLYGNATSLRAAMDAEGDLGHQQIGAEPALKDAAAERRRRRLLYAQAHQFNLSALCLSGGGIRSASVCLGVIQALADKNLLRQFNYLSTVSGGGYIGSWLSAWLHRIGNADDVVRELGEKRAFSDRETPPLEHLRRYSNYLTPKLGVFSADTWTAVAIVLRNLVVNWLILVPAIALVVVAIRFIDVILRSSDAAEPDSLKAVVAGVCLVTGWLALGYKLHRLYAPNAPRGTDIAQRRFIFFSLTPAIIGGFCFVWLLLRETTPAAVLLQQLNLEPSSELSSRTGFVAILIFAVAVFLGALAVGAVDRGLSHLSGRIRGLAPRPDLGFWARSRWIAANGLAWLAGVTTFALLVWIGFKLAGSPGERVTLIHGYCVKGVTDCVTDAKPHPINLTMDRRTLMIIFGMPAFLLATISAHTVYLLLRSASRSGDIEREWLGRASGWHFIAGLSWMLLSAVILLGPKVYEGLTDSSGGIWLSALTGTSGAITAFVGKSGLTPAKGNASGFFGIGSNVLLAIAGPLFAVLLLALLSIVLGHGVEHIPQICGDHWYAYWACGGTAHAWLLCAAMLLAVLLFMDGFANVNRFSIHALYRNRLVRAFLGGARAPRRQPDGFTDFDWDDNVRVANLWAPGTRQGGDRNWRPFHVLNMTLNLAATNNLAWQQRKASSFIVTPFSTGNADLGYRPTVDYGGPVGHPRNPRDRGITLGTALAISGAAISSNMGYHSSPSLSFLLTLFNVRLGWWLGNPGRNENWWLYRLGLVKPPYKREGPLFSIRPLLSELFGLTSADSAYVYLSDGGHFEDLGLYEMVRRRCKWILVCDCDQDGKRGFEDLGNAVRKIWIDLGVRIAFRNAPLLQAGEDTKAVEMPYFALGEIEYVSDPPIDGQVPTGQLLYIKPAVRGDEEAADIIAYQRANPDFPAQTTTDQWFDESQLEAYRRLGYLMTRRVIDGAAEWREPLDLPHLFEGLTKIDATTMRR
jgi:hypothetical protein